MELETVTFCPENELKMPVCNVYGSLWKNGSNKSFYVENVFIIWRRVWEWNNAMQ